MEYRCRKCGNGYFSIDFLSGFTTPCSNCKFTDLEKRVELYGKPEYIELLTNPTREPAKRPHIEDLIDRVIKKVVSELEIPETLSRKDLESLVKKACFAYLNNEDQSPRKIVFPWVDSLNVDDQNEFITLGLSTAKICKSSVSQYLETLDGFRYRKPTPEEIRDRNYRLSRCEYCGGSKCRWCNHTGVSWKYWMRHRRFFSKRSSIRDLMAKNPRESE